MTLTHHTTNHLAVAAAPARPSSDTDAHTTEPATGAVFDSAQTPPSFDVLLNELAAARRRRDQAQQEMRTLIALAREFTAPRPYRLTDLANAAGMSPSGIRTGYGLREITYLQLVLNCHTTAPAYLKAPLTALRHQPDGRFELST
jgi:AraC-like DNA-binding protein